MAVWPARCVIKPSCYKSPHNPGYDAGPRRWVSSQGTDGSQLWSASQQRWEERLVGLRPVLGERGWVDKSSEARLLHRGEHESPRWLATAKRGKFSSYEHLLLSADLPHGMQHPAADTMEASCCDGGY